MNISIQTQDVLHTSSCLKQKANQYEEAIQKMYMRMHEMQSVWKGTDQNAFIAQLDSFQPQLKKMTEIIRQYAAYLERSANQYEQLQNERAASARRLA